MSSFRDQIDEIKLKIKLSEELSKHIKLSQKGKDLWSLCFFHNEKTPSMKINDESSSYYCFGCGAKGDLFTFYTEYLNYSFNDALNELAKKAGVTIDYNDYSKGPKLDVRRKSFEILQLASEWFQKNLFLKENIKSLKYLKKRNISADSIRFFQIGFSSNTNLTLFEYLKKRNFSESELLQTNLFKKTDDRGIRDFFYRRIIFPIKDINSNIIGFGGRTLENIEPKYINSPENIFFKKRNVLYNLNNAKISARKKNNLLICEGYMDVISLYNKGINSVVAPLGTSMTQEQLILAWKSCKTPTIMFDGDLAGKKASIKSALLALKSLRPGFSLQFLELPRDEDPDSYVNKLSKNEFVNFLKDPKNLSNFIFDYAKNSFHYQTPDEKIIFDKYFDDITDLIENKKVKFFYKKEFKNKLFSFFKNKNNRNLYNNNEKLNEKITKLASKEVLSFIVSYINHPTIRSDLIKEMAQINYYDNSLKQCFKEISKNSYLHLSPNDLIASIKDKNILNMLEKSLKRQIYQLFPYSSNNYDPKKALEEIKKSIKIIETRLSNFSELDKSIKDFKSDVTLLKWKELKELSYDYISEIE